MPQQKDSAFAVLATALNAAAEAQVKEFLEEYPLLRALEIKVAGTDGVPLVGALSMPCPQCVDEPTTTWARQSYGPGPGGVGHATTYACVHCGKRRITFWVYENPDQVPDAGVVIAWTVRKIGQWPAWSIVPPKEVQKALPAPELDLYKKALANLSQGYGLGALAYLRRLIESQTGTLLDMIEEAAKLEGSKEALDGIAHAREQREAEERLRLAATLLPESLRPAGQNPLDALFSLFSAGLHGNLDETECLAVASDMRDALDYVFTRMRRNIDEARGYRASIERASALAAKARKKPGSGAAKPEGEQ